MEAWGTVPAWITILVASFAAALALRQPRLATIVQNAQFEIARANLLLVIDKQFESDELCASRRAVRGMRNRAETYVKSLPGTRTPDEEKQAVAVRVSEEMNAIWKLARSISDVDVDPTSEKHEAMKRYHELTMLTNWMETVGMLCRKNLLPTSDILDLYDQAIMPTIYNSLNHIKVRRDEGPHRNPRYMENAEWLHVQAVEYIKARDNPVNVPVKRSRLPW